MFAVCLRGRPRVYLAVLSPSAEDPKREVLKIVEIDDVLLRLCRGISFHQLFRETHQLPERPFRRVHLPDRLVRRIREEPLRLLLQLFPDTGSGARHRILHLRIHIRVGFPDGGQPAKFQTGKAGKTLPQ